MPKKKSSRPAASLGSNQISEPKSASQIKRERIVRIAAITIVLALLLSLLAGAFSVTPSQAAEPGGFVKSVQILYADDSPVGTGIDTDGDGIINNEDSDIDNDGLVNANDGDIDGDGISNFDDGDPAATNGFDSKPPQAPEGREVQVFIEKNKEVGPALLAGLFLVVGVSIFIIFRARKTAKKLVK
jgi:hypothetical protein